jgi:hypothetical protein
MSCRTERLRLHWLRTGAPYSEVRFHHSRKTESRRSRTADLFFLGHVNRRQSSCWYGSKRIFLQVQHGQYEIDSGWTAKSLSLIRPAAAQPSRLRPSCHPPVPAPRARGSLCLLVAWSAVLRKKPAPEGRFRDRIPQRTGQDSNDGWSRVSDSAHCPPGDSTSRASRASRPSAKSLKKLSGATLSKSDLMRCPPPKWKKSWALIGGRV